MAASGILDSAIAILICTWLSVSQLSHMLLPVCHAAEMNRSGLYNSDVQLVLIAVGDTIVGLSMALLVHVLSPRHGMDFDIWALVLKWKHPLVQP